MNKTDALKQIEELKAKLAELEATVKNEPEYKPEDLVGKLCYVWDNDESMKVMRLVVRYEASSNFCFLTGDLGGFSAGWAYARPVPEAEALKMIYRQKKEDKYGPWYRISFPAHAQKPSRLDWSKAPKEAKYMYTNANGDVLWSTSPMSCCIRKRIWETLSNRDYDQWGYVSQGNAPFPDGDDSWEDSEEVWSKKKETRYDWSKVPKEAKYMYTDANGDIFCSSYKATASVFEELSWGFLPANRFADFEYISTGNPPCEDWKDSEESRPE